MELDVRLPHDRAEMILDDAYRRMAKQIFERVWNWRPAETALEEIRQRNEVCRQLLPSFEPLDPLLQVHVVNDVGELLEIAQRQKHLIESLAKRVAAQAELLSRRAQKPASSPS